MKLLNTYKMSEFAFYECRDVDNCPKIRKLITNGFWMARYCFEVGTIHDLEVDNPEELEAMARYLEIFKSNYYPVQSDRRLWRDK